MVSGWWLLVTFWIGGCVGIMLATLLQIVRDEDDAGKLFLSQGHEQVLEKRRTPER